MVPSVWRNRPDHVPRRGTAIAPSEERTTVPRKPNYKFERMERDRAKAAKKAERLKLKQERAEQRKAELAGPTESAEQAGPMEPVEQAEQAAVEE